MSKVYTDDEETTTTLTGYNLYKSSSFTLNTSDEELVAERIKRALLTPLGARPHELDYGSALSQYIFDPDTSAQKVVSEISRVINKWVPEVTLNSVAIGSNEDGILTIDLNINLTSTGKNVTVDLDI